MPIVKYIVELSDKERKRLKTIVSKGKYPANVILRANILLSTDKNAKHPLSTQEIAMAFNTSQTTVQHVRTTYVERGLDAAIFGKKREIPPAAVKVTGDIEARIIALACSNPPEGVLHGGHWAVVRESGGTRHR